MEVKFMYTKEAIINSYKELCIKLNKNASIKDIREAYANKEFICDYNTVVYNFGGINNLREKCKYPVVIPDGGGLSKKYDVDEILLELYEQKRSYGRKLTRREYNSIKSLPKIGYLYQILSIHSYDELWNIIDVKFNDN
jgi:hypothetical protein